MSPTNSLLAVAVKDGSVGVIDVLCRRLVRIIKNAHNAAISFTEFSPDSKWLITTDVVGMIKVLDKFFIPTSFNKQNE